MTGAGITALVLAGHRDGTLDPLAAAADVTHKCLVPIAGQPLIAHVLTTLAGASAVGQILVSIDDEAALANLPVVARLRAEGRLRVVEARRNLVDSVIDALRNARFPVLVTTADNVLLTADAVATLARRVQDGEVLVAMARREDVLAAHPEGQRRFYRFRNGDYSNCNLYWLSSRRVLGVTEVFRRGGQFAKHPARLVMAFGLMNLLRFSIGWDSIGETFIRLSRRFGTTIRPVIVDDGALAIDVDNVRTYGIAAELLARREAPRAAA